MISSLAFLVGPWILVTSAFAKDRLMVTLGYIVSAALTMYCSVGLESSILTLVALGVQMVASLWLALRYQERWRDGASFSLTKLHSFLPFSASWMGYASRSVLPL